MHSSKALFVTNKSSTCSSRRVMSSTLTDGLDNDIRGRFVASTLHLTPFHGIPRSSRGSHTPRALSCGRIGIGTPLTACRSYVSGGTRVWSLLVLHGVSLVWTVRLVGAKNLLNLLNLLNPFVEARSGRAQQKKQTPTAKQASVSSHANPNMIP